MTEGFGNFAPRLERAAGPPLSRTDHAALFGTVAAALLMAPVGDDEILHGIGPEVAALVWRDVVLTLTEHPPVRQALLHFASCRYWLRRLATEAAVRNAAHGPALTDDDPIWPLWGRLAREIRAQERYDA